MAISQLSNFSEQLTQNGTLLKTICNNNIIEIHLHLDFGNCLARGITGIHPSIIPWAIGCWSQETQPAATWCGLEPVPNGVVSRHTRPQCHQVTLYGSSSH